MNSPFPGMDPYLERYWRSVHHNLITYTQEQLSAQLPGDLMALVGERVFVETTDEGRSIYPDVYVTELPQSVDTTSEDSGGVALAEPLVITLPAEPVTQAFIEIREAGTGNRVITVIEFLSPTNKVPGEGKDLYLQKQKECLASSTNLVEIDLVRQGSWTIAVPRALVPPKRAAIYNACVRRAGDALHVNVYPLPLRERLPAIPVPLRATDADAKLDLHALVDRCYQLGRFGNSIDYGAPLDVPLNAADGAWADELIRGRGRSG